MDFLTSPYVIISDRESTLVKSKWHDVPIVMQTDPDQHLKDETELVVETCKTIAATPNEEVERKLKELLDRTREKYARDSVFSTEQSVMTQSVISETKECDKKEKTQQKQKEVTPDQKETDEKQETHQETHQEEVEQKETKEDTREETKEQRELEQKQNEQESVEEQEEYWAEERTEEGDEEGEEEEGDEEYVSLADLEKPYCHTKDIELNYTILLLAMNELNKEDNKMPPLIEDVDDEPVTQTVVPRSSCKKWSVAIVFIWLLISYQILTRFSELDIS